MLSHGIGMVENPTGLHRFLDHANTLTEDDGIVIFDSVDVRGTDNPTHLSYQERNKKRGRYPGEIHMYFKYKGMNGEQFSWLHIDPDTLRQELIKTNWSCELIHQEAWSDYLVKLTKR